MEKPLFKFGIIADVQYADLPKGTNYDKSAVRYYRETLGKMDRAVEWWKEENVGFVLSLGDVIDGYNKQYNTETEALEMIMEKFDSVGVKHHQLVGNHELLNFPRDTLLSHGWGLPCGQLYYTFEPSPGWKVLVLNSYEISVIQHTDHNYHNPPNNEVLKMLQKNNKNLAVLPPGRWNETNWYSGLDTEHQRYLPYNGMFGEVQLKWVKAELAEAAGKGERVIVCSHTPVHHGASNHCDIAMDGPELVSLLHKHPSTVVAVLCGHNHNGGRCVDEAGIRHITFESPLETDPSVPDCSAVADVFPDKISIRGKGSVPSTEIFFK
eukprot:TRINITY_DN507_c0_g3_i1.p1 TRINITY_DN507_c0_g3~~TRINITY_DN507_c0_g3_i1.p1  ORF type:complete len:323 (+),score=49.67 TRINITY_DN507_c0_g3_i1:69-1037(+)